MLCCCKYVLALRSCCSAINICISSGANVISPYISISSGPNTISPGIYALTWELMLYRCIYMHYLLELMLYCHMDLLAWEIILYCHIYMNTLWRKLLCLFDFFTKSKQSTINYTVVVLQFK